jgi:hypothetical protein
MGAMTSGTMVRFASNPRDGDMLTIGNDERSTVVRFRRTPRAPLDVKIARSIGGTIANLLIIASGSSNAVLRSRRLSYDGNAVLMIEAA